MTINRNRITWLAFGLLAVLLIFIDIGAIAGRSPRFFAFVIFCLIAVGLFFFWFVRALRTKDYILLIKIVLTPLIILTVHISLNFYRIKMDGVRAEIFALLVGENSVYSEGYSHKAFSELRIGLTVDQVLARLGEPTWKVPYTRHSGAIGDTTTFYYCTDGHDTHRRVRLVLIHADTVRSIKHSFYYD
jgi:hypothetical protein